MTPGWPRHGGQMRAIAERFNVAEAELLDFSANINPDGPPRRAEVALRECLEDGSVLTRYPDLEEVRLRGAIGEAVGVAPRQVATGNGFAPLLEATLRASSVARCLLPVPCFGEYRRALERLGVGVTTYALDAAKGFAYCVDSLREELTRGCHDALLLANPQNPTGALCPGDEMLKLLAWTAEQGVHVFLDEAFIDYAPGASLASRVGDLPRVTVFRSLTKFYAIPGLRVSYAVAGGEMAEEIRGQMAPWPVTTIASRVAAAVVGDADFGERTRSANERRRSVLAEALSGLGVRVYAGAANFLLIRPIANRRSAGLWERLICEGGIVLRNCANFEGLETGHYRVAVRSSADNERLVCALRKVLHG